MYPIFAKKYLSLSIFMSLCGTGTIVYAEEDSKKDKAKTLDTIVVTATGYEQDILNAPASMTVINREELDKREYKDITDVLRNAPGVVISGSGAAQTVSIRGMSSNYTLFLVNGKRQFSKDVNPNGDDYGFEKNILPPIASIERIEIIRGPASTLYGTDAMGGVINIITKKVSDVWSGSVDLGGFIQDSGRSADIKQGTAVISGPILSDRLGMQLTANKLKRDEDRYVGGFTAIDRESVGAKLNYVLNDQHDLELDTNFIKQKASSTVGKTIVPTGIDSSTRSYRSVYSLTHNGQYSDRLNSTSYVQYEDSKNPDRANNKLGTKGIDLETWILNSQWNLNLEDHTLSVGANYKDESLNDKATNSNPNIPYFSTLTRWSAAAFAEDTWHMTDKFDLTGGVRYDHDENYGGHVSPRLYGVYRFMDGLNLKGGISTGYKQPDIRAATPGFYAVTGGSGSPTPTGRGIIRANPDLKPEESISTELGLNWEHDYFTASLTGYITQFKDKITEVRTCETDTNGSTANRNKVSAWKCNEGATKFYFISDRINVDEAELKGLEATFTTKLTDDVGLNANYTYTNTKIKSGQFKGQSLNEMPKHMANLTLDYDIRDDLNLWSRWHYRDKTSAYLSRTSMAKGNPGYKFFDIGANYKLTDYLKAKMGIYNLLDDKAEDINGEQQLDGRRYGISLVASF